MKFIEAIAVCEQGRKITRENWRYFLHFEVVTQTLCIWDKRGDLLTPYAISSYDFDYEWEVMK